MKVTGPAYSYRWVRACSFFKPMLIRLCQPFPFPTWFGGSWRVLNEGSHVACHLVACHLKVTGRSVHEEFPPFAQNKIVTDANFHGKLYQGEESISLLPTFSKVRWGVRKQRLASFSDRMFLFSTGMPIKGSIRISHLRLQAWWWRCVCMCLWLGGMG